jgi:hypothetical protein
MGARMKTISKLKELPPPKQAFFVVLVHSIGKLANLSDENPTASVV